MPDLALKVDVDTFRGMKEGVPAIAQVLDDYGLKASFFISFGPDRSGLAVLQLLRPSFLRKMIRTNAPGLYGWKTALYGTLLRAPMIGIDFPERTQDLIKAGHEVACHAWDHRLWQDWLPYMSTVRLRRWFTHMIDAYTSLTGKAPASFGAPGWRMDTRVLHLTKEFGFQYLSCTRAQRPFIFAENDLMEIPSNLPCIEEVGIQGVKEALTLCSDSTWPSVLPVHAEVEGGMYLHGFSDVLSHAISLGYSFHTVHDIATNIEISGLPFRRLRTGIIKGRGFPCAI